MASYPQPNIETKVAGGAITQYRAVKYTSDNQTVVQCGAGDQGCGIAQNSGASGDPIEVAMPGGGAKWECGGTITGPGLKFCKADVNGKAVLASGDGDWAMGLVESGASGQVAGDVAPCFVQPSLVGAAQS